MGNAKPARVVELTLGRIFTMSFKSYNSFDSTLGRAP
jgi:hypothetical protein